ncbi:NAD(P)H nitroreductase [Geodermatophilus marinus]|nr:NAD(P)H nitroreductase [Geodermatophilus sp. LHW52908]
MAAPSVHNTQPWRIVLHADRLDLRADRTRQLTTVDPGGRELAQSVGAALFNARVALAAGGWAAQVHRLPDPEDPDLLAVVHPVASGPDPALAALAAAVPQRHTDRRRFSGTPVPDDLLRHLTAEAAQEGTELLPVVREEHRRLLARLTRKADHLQNADAAYRAEIRRWTTRRRGAGDGVPASAVPHVDDRQRDDRQRDDRQRDDRQRDDRQRGDLPLRDFDTTGAGALPADHGSGPDQTLVLLASREDDQHACLRAGEALERVLLGLTRLGWAASPVTQAVEVPRTREQLRSALTGGAHPQNVLRIGRAVPGPPTPRRRRDAVVENSTRPPGPPTAPHHAGPTGWPVAGPAAPSGRRPVSDGRGGTTWS